MSVVNKGHISRRKKLKRKAVFDENDDIMRPKKRGRGKFSLQDYTMVLPHSVCTNFTKCFNKILVFRITLMVGN